MKTTTHSLIFTLALAALAGCGSAPLQDDDMFQTGETADSLQDPVAIAGGTLKAAIETYKFLKGSCKALAWGQASVTPSEAGKLCTREKKSIRDGCDAHATVDFNVVCEDKKDPSSSGYAAVDPIAKAEHSGWWPFDSYSIELWVVGHHREAADGPLGSATTKLWAEAKAGNETDGDGGSASASNDEFVADRYQVVRGVSGDAANLVATVTVEKADVAANGAVNFTIAADGAPIAKFGASSQWNTLAVSGLDMADFVVAPGGLGFELADTLRFDVIDTLSSEDQAPAGITLEARQDDDGFLY